MINNNMRCIETGFFAAEVNGESAINNNMRCIETDVAFLNCLCNLSDKQQRKLDEWGDILL